MSRRKSITQLEPWKATEIDNIGKIGLSDDSFPTDDEDYSQW